MKDNIFVRKNSILLKVNQQDIHFINAEGNYCIVNTLSGKKYSVKISLTAFMEQLNPQDFAQVHRGYIVQLNLINTVDTVNSMLSVNGLEIPIGKKFRDMLLNDKINVV
jgi:DNA-binding LytR/AlgR family response regulator